MKQACWLLAFFICWSAAGFVFFGNETGLAHDRGPHPDRIVSLAPNITEILFALGLEKQVVGVTLDCDYPPQTATKTRVGTFWQPDIESVIALRPQLIVTLGFQQQRNLAERLARIGCNCLTVDIETTADLYAATEQIGLATDTADRARELVADMQTQLQQIGANVAGRDRIKVLWVIQRQPLRVAGRNTFANEIIEFAGGENAIGPTLHQYPPIGAEQVLTCNAEVIIEPAMGSTDLAAQQGSAIQYWSAFGSLSAVVNRRIFVINPDTVTRLGPRLCRGVRTVAKCLRPELFEN